MAEHCLRCIEPTGTFHPVSDRTYFGYSFFTGPAPG